MSVITVNGEISKNELGITSTHEHIFVELSKDIYEYERKPNSSLKDLKVNIEVLGLLNRNPFAIKDNLILSDSDVLKEELLKFKKAGGKTIVDPTTVDIGRNPVGLKKLSKESGLNIITTTGYYRKRFHPKEVDELSLEGHIEKMVEEIEIGIGNTGVRAGMIGELGTSEIIYPEEEKILIAAARVNKELGVPIMVHFGAPWIVPGVSVRRLELDVLKILQNNGANLEKVNLCHQDIFFDLDIISEAISMGSFISFDCFGEQFCFDPDFMYNPTDMERIKNLMKLIDKGFINKILIACDTAFKQKLHKYGGWGYDHILTNIIPYLTHEGLSDNEINTLLIENSKNFLNIEKSSIKK